MCEKIFQGRLKPGGELAVLVHVCVLQMSASRCQVIELGSGPPSAGRETLDGLVCPDGRR